jgi:hypothetical protein
MGPSAYDPEQRVIADWEHQPSGETRCGTSAQGKAKMVNDAVEPPGPSRRWR